MDKTTANAEPSSAADVAMAAPPPDQDPTSDDASMSAPLSSSSFSSSSSASSSPSSPSESDTRVDSPEPTMKSDAQDAEDVAMEDAGADDAAASGAPESASASASADGEVAPEEETKAEHADDAKETKLKVEQSEPTVEDGSSAAGEENAEADIEQRHSDHEAAEDSGKRREAEMTNPETGSDASEGTTEDAEPASKKQKIEVTEQESAPEEHDSKPADAPIPPQEEASAAPTSDAAAATATPAASTAPLMLSRDDMAKMEEDDGVLKFDVITNDGAPEHLIQLTTLKNIFAKQLPKMPREYIVRLVFDRNHRSMIILKNGTHVIGGICYRPFEPNHFAEIAFCAINAADQVKGYGTRLMNHLKEFVKQSGITHFLTYADNYAIGYFKKQGFAKVVSMPRNNWFGFIKDYDGGTLMECTIHHQINYLRITSMVHEQRRRIQEKIRERSRASIVYDGLAKFAEGRTMDIYMIPGVKEAGWSPAVIRNSRVGTRDQGSLRTQLQQLWKAITNHRSAWPFHEPVDTTVVKDYLEHIKEPVDLSLILKRMDSGHYLSKATFKADLDLMCANCMSYNLPDTNYYKAAKDLQEFINRRIQLRDA